MKKYLAEAIGTFVLVLIGCGTAALIGCDVTGGYLATTFAFGLSIVVVWVFIVAPIIGGALAAVCYKALASDAE